MIQLKYSCSCGKRILAPTTHLHQNKPCPRCHQSVKIPGFGEPAFLLLLCECGESISQYTPQCPKCQRSIPENLKAPPASPPPAAPPETALVSAVNKNSESPSDAANNALPLHQKSPEGFRPLIKMKIRCSCGKRMMVWTRNIGKEEICPKCQHAIRLPPSTASNVLHFVCDCGTYVSVREDICVTCQKDLKESASPPETLSVQTKDSQAPASDSDTTDLSEVKNVPPSEEKK